MPRHAEVAGAGFAGLAAATALCQRGWTVRVHEQDAALRAFGAGIHVWRNGLLALQALGALQGVANGCSRPPCYENRTNDAQTSFECINAPGKDVLWSMTRQHLHRAMVDAAHRAGVEIVTNSTAVGATPDGMLLLADGSRPTADLVIGADGVRSRVRDSLGFSQTRQRYKDGLIRVLADRRPLGAGMWDNVIDFWHTRDRTLRILYSPVSEHEIYLAMMAPRNDAEASSIPVRPDAWLDCFPQFEPILMRLGSRGRYDLYETTRLDRWSAGNVAILGDAAHAMPPTLGQGACSAICNALGLAVALDEAGSVPEALALWEARERPLTDHTQSRAAEIAATRVLAGGMDWDDVGMRAARHIPTGAIEMALT